MGVVSVSEAVAQSLRHGINLYKSRSHFFTLYPSKKPSLETPKTNPGTNHTNSKLASESPCCCHLLPYWFHHCTYRAIRFPSIATKASGPYDRPCKAFCTILSKKVSREIPDAVAIAESTLISAKEQYSPASKNQGCPSGSMRKSNKL